MKVLACLGKFADKRVVEFLKDLPVAKEGRNSSIPL